MDWRVVIIVGSWGVAVLCSWLLWHNGYGHNPATFPGAVFASWVAGLALFAVVGLVVAVAQLARPEDESFDARARILFRRQSGPHIDYIIGKLKNLFEHYSESVQIRVSIEDFNKADQKYLITSDVRTVVKSYMEDIKSTYASAVKLSDVAEPPPGGLDNRVLFLRVNGVAQPECCKSFNKEFSYPFNTEIDRNKPCLIEYKYHRWTKADEENNNLKLIRFTKLLVLTIENLLPDNQTMTVKVSHDMGESWEDMLIAAGEAKHVLRRSDAQPAQEIYRYRILPI